MAFSKGRKTTSAETMDEDIFARMPQNELSNKPQKIPLTSDENSTA